MTRLTPYLKAKYKAQFIKELSARIPYNVKAKVLHYKEPQNITSINPSKEDCTIEGSSTILHIFSGSKQQIKPYLRPLTSMTEEERDELEEISNGWLYANEDGELFPVGQMTDSGEIEHIYDSLDWIISHHFDYREWIDCGFALKAPKDMYENE